MNEQKCEKCGSPCCASRCSSLGVNEKVSQAASEGVPQPPERIWISPAAFLYKTKPAPTYWYDEHNREPQDIEYVRVSPVTVDEAETKRSFVDDPIGVRCQSCGGRAGLDFHDEKCPYAEADRLPEPTPVRVPPLVRCLKCAHRGFLGMFLKCPTCGCECVWPASSSVDEAARRAARVVAERFPQVANEIDEHVAVGRIAKIIANELKNSDSGKVEK